MTLLSTVTMIVWTHQLYSCHNTAAVCWIIWNFHNALCLRLQQAQYTQQRFT